MPGMLVKVFSVVVCFLVCLVWKGKKETGGTWENNIGRFVIITISARSGHSCILLPFCFYLL